MLAAAVPSTPTENDQADIQRLRTELSAVQDALDDCVNTVSESLPQIMPCVLVARRDTVIPAVSCMIRHVRVVTRPSRVTLDRIRPWRRGINCVTCSLML